MVCEPVAWQIVTFLASATWLGLTEGLMIGVTVRLTPGLAFGVTVGITSGLTEGLILGLTEGLALGLTAGMVVSSSFADIAMSPHAESRPTNNTNSIKLLENFKVFIKYVPHELLLQDFGI
ncbi:MAG: hypothetical protein BGO39_21810 [Chloroflexi bacterium 54-19]|nr:MAG: hypothetical protein BGO39_21810 [Chloroflexi bacterium 54-19]